MNQLLRLLLLTSAVGAVGVTGCCHRCCRPDTFTSSAPPCCDPLPAGRLRPFHPLTPQRVDALPGPLPPARQDVLGPPAIGLPGLPPPGTPAAPPADFRNYPPPAPPEPSWRPSPDAPPTPPEPPRSGARLYPPETPEPPTRPDAPPEKPATPSPPLPSGIAQFALVRNRVASGLKPSLEGLDWLRDNGYRTVVHVRRPSEDDAADRRLVEDRRGMKFASLELSPQNLREAVDQFNHLIGEVSCLPVFVYDGDGTLQGFLWYLHFRIVELVPDDEARVRARRLGLREPATDEQRELWLAVQKYLGSSRDKRDSP